MLRAAETATGRTVALLAHSGTSGLLGAPRAAASPHPTARPRRLHRHWEGPLNVRALLTDLTPATRATINHLVAADRRSTRRCSTWASGSTVGGPRKRSCGPPRRLWPDQCHRTWRRPCWARSSSPGGSPRTDPAGPAVEPDGYEVDGVVRCASCGDTDGLPAGLLAPSVAAVVRDVLQAELSGGLPATHSYLVQDPYGEELLDDAVGRWLGRPEWAGSTTTGPSADSLLAALALLAAEGTVRVIGEGAAAFVGPALALGARSCSSADPTVVHLRRPWWPGSLHRLAKLCTELTTHSPTSIVVVDETDLALGPPTRSAAGAGRSRTQPRRDPAPAAGSRAAAGDSGSLHRLAGSRRRGPRGRPAAIRDSAVPHAGARAAALRAGIAQVYYVGPRSSRTARVGELTWRPCGAPAWRTAGSARCGSRSPRRTTRRRSASRPESTETAATSNGFRCTQRTRRSLTRALRFCVHHLLIAANPEDPTVSIGANALAGERYRGHVFSSTASAAFAFSEAG